jgi:hypothetical protein
MRVLLSHKERDLLAAALYRLTKADPSPKIVFKVGRILEAIDDDERVTYYQALQERLRSQEIEWRRKAALSEDPGAPPRLLRTDLLGNEREFEILDRDVEFIRKALEDPRTVVGLLRKFGIEGD